MNSFTKLDDEDKHTKENKLKAEVSKWMSVAICFCGIGSPSSVI
jgi:hypothetical protein